MIDMPNDRPRYLQKQVTRHGKVAWYVRIGRGPKIRILGKYGSDEFRENYDAAISGQPRVKKGTRPDTLEWLINLHRKSGFWSNLAPSTRVQRDRIFRQVLKTAGKKLVAHVDKQTIVKGRDRRRETPSEARHFVDAMRSLFKWALDSDLVKIDPTVGVKTKKPDKDGITPWTEDDILKFEKRWPRGTRERVMFDIFVYTGLRIGDASVLGKQHVKNGVIAIDTEKTGTRVTIPVLAPLAATLKAGPTGDLTFIATKTGRGMLKNSVGNSFREAARAAGVDKSPHGIRKAAATHAADNGATEAELEAIFGWVGGAMASHYTREANRKKLAKGAMSKLNRGKSRTAMLPPPDQVVAKSEKPQRKQR
jgi:integrase